MNIDALFGILLTTAICAVLAFVASLLLKRRHSVLAYIGAGLFGQALGGWIAGALHATAWPGAVSIGGGVHLLWTFLGALLVLAVFRVVPRGG